ncbi:secondary thiamine-phosphate synthase enzyme YjbQ [Kaarinaea lacus]
MIIHNEAVNIATKPEISVFDISEAVRDVVRKSKIKNGLVSITSQHTTTAICINEYEERLLEDIRRYFSRLVPKDNAYLHNDIHLRDCPPDEPENAHAHIMAILFGSSETVSVVDCELKLGTYQGIMLLELDGPRNRTVNVQVMGVA